MGLGQGLSHKAFSSMTQEELENFDTAKHIFDFHRSIDFIRKVSGDELNSMRAQPIRVLIMAVLNDGILDLYPGSKDKKIRKAMSAKEILLAINHRLENDITRRYAPLINVKRPNLFFHLNKLEELGVISEVGIIKAGRRRTTYFGRTAIMHISTNVDHDVKLSIHKNNQFIAFLEKLNPDRTRNELTIILNKIEALNRPNNIYFIEWIEEYGDVIKEYEFNYMEIFELFSLMYQINEDVVDGLQELADLLQVDKSKLPPKPQ